ncbi:MAG: hypothetical protein GX326_05235 [Clostridiaceae bacterium]|nr:hypothetical protein [Clostridiaceae bacterium]
MLNKKRKYYWDRSISNQTHKGLNKNIVFQQLRNLLFAEKYELVSNNNNAFIFEKSVPFYNIKFKKKNHRVFLIYRHLFNVLIIDRILSETEDFIKNKNKDRPTSQNSIIFLTDMNNKEEILSAGTGIVNYLSATSTAYLFPIFIDINFGHIFYPQDISLLPWYKRIAVKLNVYKTKKSLKSITETPQKELNNIQNGNLKSKNT